MRTTRSLALLRAGALHYGRMRLIGIYLLQHGRNGEDMSINCIRIAEDPSTHRSYRYSYSALSVVLISPRNLSIDRSV